MEWKILIGPIIGAIIGYITNKVAVEMLFHPLKPIYIGKFHIPFTPGIIPKEKGRLGKAIGDAVGNDLLTPASMKKTLLSQKMLQDIEEQLDTLFSNLSQDNDTFESKIQFALGDVVTTQVESKLKHALTQKVSQALIDMSLGELVADEVMAAVQAKVKGTMLSMMINASTLAPIIEEIKVRVNQYMQDHSEEKVDDFIQAEFKNLMEQPMSYYFTNYDITELKQIILNIYCTLVNNYADQILNNLNLSKIVEEKIGDMEVQEVQNLILSIMKKELGAVVNLGALIGFILGLANIIF